jgi:hypothetical protein
LEFGRIGRIIGREIDQGCGMSIFETTEVIVRRILTDYLGRDARSLGEQFRWIDEVTPEDQGWFLHEIEHRFGRNKMFKRNLTTPDLEELGTMGRLSTYIDAQLRR